MNMQKIPECSIQKRHYLTEQKYKSVPDNSFWKITVFLFGLLLIALFAK